MQINKTREKENEILWSWKEGMINDWVQESIARCLIDRDPLLKIAISLAEQSLPKILQTVQIK